MREDNILLSDEIMIEGMAHFGCLIHPFRVFTKEKSKIHPASGDKNSKDDS